MAALIRQALIDLARSGSAILVISQDLDEIFEVADRIAVISRGQLSEAYANMDVFVFPSDTDAFGNVVQEANAAGVPCIVSDKGGP